MAAANPILKGIRVIEVAQYVFVPVAAGVLAEWGADVIKIEHPLRGDAYRGIRRTADQPVTASEKSPRNIAVEHANRGKRSLGLDLTHPEGRATLGRLLATADVLVTNLLPASRDRLGLDEASVRRDNPQLIFARGTALGERGPERERGGFDHATFWARSGAQYGSTPADASRPSPMPSGAFGDSAAGLALAGGIAGALFARERTGEATTVDLSLLGMGLWSMASATHGAMLHGEPPEPMPRVPSFNPLAGTYRTRDGRFVVLGLLQGFPQWSELCRCLDRPEWAADPRFREADAYGAHLGDVQSLLESRFAEEDLADWQQRLRSLDAVWEAVQNPLEASRDPQAEANGYIAPLGDGRTEDRLVSSPVQFGESPNSPRPAPEPGQHTEALLEELGLGWDEITHLKRLGTIN